MLVIAHGARISHLLLALAAQGASEGHLPLLLAPLLSRLPGPSPSCGDVVNFVSWRTTAFFYLTAFILNVIFAVPWCFLRGL